MANNNEQTLKQQVGRAAVEYVRDGMKIGIGTGSTAEAFIEALAEKVAQGLNVVGVPTSVRTRDLCQKLGIALTTLDETPHLDITIDGADEIDPKLNLIKGGGGALLREKIVASASDEMIVIADESKLVPDLGAFDLPIEVNAFGFAATKEAITHVAKACSTEGPLSLRMTDKGEPFVTDGGHWIIDASFGRIVQPEALDRALNQIPGVVENGLFTGIATRAIVAGNDGIFVVEPAE